MKFTGKEVRQIRHLANELGISPGVAQELLILAGGDIDKVIEASDSSLGLGECKAKLIDGRFRKLEDQ